MMIELDELSTELVGLILDVLENYELYRLCLVLCGRYQLFDRLGRYISAVGQKYSNLNSNRVLAFGGEWRKQTIDSLKSYSLIAHEAMHNVISLASSCVQEGESLTLR